MKSSAQASRPSEQMGLFRDKRGKVVLIQSPNLVLLLWLAGKLVSKVSSGTVQNLANVLSFGFIFVWAWLEVTTGVNYFRRLLGCIVLFMIIKSRI